MYVNHQTLYLCQTDFNRLFGSSITIKEERRLTI